MKFGMPTLIELPDMEDSARLCRELGLQFVEFNMNLPQYQPHTLDRRGLDRIRKEYGISYTVHLDENMNVADFNPYVMEGYFRTVKETVNLAKDLEIPVLNMHLSRGVHFTLPDRKVFLFDQFREDYLRRIRAFRDFCTETVGNAPIKICLENYSGYLDFQKEAIGALLESPVFGLTLDVGHNHCTEHCDEAITLKNRSRLCHMHLHDARGKQDHQALGDGEVDIRRYFDLARSCGCSVLLETKTIAGLRTSVEWKNKNLLFNDV